MEAHPDQMRAIASKVNESADIVRKSAGSRSAALAPTGGQGADWTTAATARTAADAWSAFTGQLAGAVAGLSGALTTAADAYVTADQAAADRHNRFRNLE